MLTEARLLIFYCNELYISIWGRNDEKTNGWFL